MRKTHPIYISAMLIIFSVFQSKAQNFTGNIPDYAAFIIKNASSGKCMQVSGDTLFNEKYKNKALIVQSNAEYGNDHEIQPYQRWHIIFVKSENDTSYYYLRNVFSGKMLDIAAGSKTPGVQAQQLGSYTIPSNEMLWSIFETSAGKYKIINKASRLALTNKDASANNNNPLTQEVYSGGNEQLWELSERSLCAYRDDDVVRFFERNNKAYGSSAFDQASSIPLANGKVLWVTQDSWDGNQLQTINNLFLSSAYFAYGNSMFLQASVTDWSVGNAPNITRENSAQNRPRQICDIQANQSFAWPSNGVEIDGKVYLHCGEGNGLSGEKQSLYEIYPKTAGSSLWKSIRHEINGMTNNKVAWFANGMVKADDGYVYVFGSRTFGFGFSMQLFVARFAQNNPLTNWGFWDGSQWATTAPNTEEQCNKAQIFEGIGASSAVGYIQGKYVLITLDQGFWATNERYIRAAVADSPTSGFGTSKRIYPINEYIYGQKVRYYSPNIHTQYINGHNELLVTYSVNYSTTDTQDITVNSNNQKVVNGKTITKGAYIDPYFYRVKGVRVPYAIIGIPDDVSAVKNTRAGKNETQIFPNPTTESIRLSNQENLSGENYCIYNTYGQCILNGNISTNEINISQLKSGVYLFQVKTKDIAQSFVKL